MIDRRKVVVMTRVAMEESKNRKKVSPAMSYFADDYVSLQVLKGILGVTLVYLIGVACWGLYTADTWMAYSFEELFYLAIYIGILYLCVLALTILVLILVYAVRYYQSKRILRQEISDLKKLDRHYEQQKKKG